MRNVILYGLGKSASRYLERIEKDWSIIAVSDSFTTYQEWNGYRFVSPENIKYLSFDYIIVSSSMYFNDISDYLEQLGIEKEYIVQGWYKEVSELSYWQDTLKRERRFENNHYRELMLSLAQESDDEFLRGKIVADFGCGPRGSLAWTDAPLIKIGIDVLIPEYIKINDLTKHGMLYVTAVEDVIPIPDQYVDYLIALEVLDRVNNIKTTIKEISRILKVDGILLGCFPLNEPQHYDDGQTYSFDESVISLLIEDYDIISVRIAERSQSYGGKLDPYYNMIHKAYVTHLNAGQMGFMWFKARRK